MSAESFAAPSEDDPTALELVVVATAVIGFESNANEYATTAKAREHFRSQLAEVRRGSCFCFLFFGCCDLRHCASSPLENCTVSSPPLCLAFSLPLPLYELGPNLSYA